MIMLLKGVSLVTLIIDIDTNFYRFTPDDSTHNHMHTQICVCIHVIGYNPGIFFYRKTVYVR